jgi:acetylornithine aminotransferase
MLINVTAGNVVRLLPPLILTTAQADELITTVATLIKQFLSK